MLDKLVILFVGFQIRIGTIDESDINVYRYGYTLMIEVLLNVCLSCLIGVLLGYLEEVLFFLAIFIPLRSFCGGYHAEKTWKCILLSNLLLIIAIYLMLLWGAVGLSFFTWSILEIVCFVFVLFLAPIESSNKKLGKRERQQYKKYSVWIFLIEFLLGVVYIAFSKSDLLYLTLAAHLLQVFSLEVAVMNDTFTVSK